MSKRKMTRLRAQIMAGIQPVPSDADALFESIRAYLETRTGLPVELHFEPMPERTASGLTIRLADRVIIVVERHTTTLHQLVILAHEIWHALEGKCQGHPVREAAVAARSLTARLDLDAGAIRSLAARAHADSAGAEEEADAETFGLLLGNAFRPYLEVRPASDGVAARIQASLGHRGA
ncbi:toxin-antitoxin system, toxin component [Streptomyces sp. NPDC020875]|uniref:toxin-antitoxin system, toxin component n=1 Tax=Streptomyces sp. NPDC020875 TaxID=3154898 RepID=UPI00340DA44B